MTPAQIIEARIEKLTNDFALEGSMEECFELQRAITELKLVLSEINKSKQPTPLGEE